MIFTGLGLNKSTIMWSACSILSRTNRTYQNLSYFWPFRLYEQLYAIMPCQILHFVNSLLPIDKFCRAFQLPFDKCKTPELLMLFDPLFMFLYSAIKFPYCQVSLQRDACILYRRSDFFLC